MKTLEDERREREENEAGDPEDLLHIPPPDEPADEAVLEEGIPTSEVATVVIDTGGIPTRESAVVVDMNTPPHDEGVDVVDIESPGTEVETDRKKGKRRDGRDGAEMMGAELVAPERETGWARAAAGRRGRKGTTPRPEAADLSAILEGPAERLVQRTRLRDVNRKRKLAYLLSQEVRRVVEELELRHRLLMEVWTRNRARQPLLNVLRTRYEEVTPDDLLLLPVDCLEHLDRFYRMLDEFRLYLMTTEDMPTALEQSYERFRLRLSQIARPLLWFLDETHRHDEAMPSLMPRSGEIMDG